MLMEKVQKATTNASVIMYSNGDGEENDFLFFKHNSATASEAKTFKEIVIEPLPKSQACVFFIFSILYNKWTDQILKMNC